MIHTTPTITERTRVINGRKYRDWRAYCGCISKRKIVFFGKTPDLARRKAEFFIRDYKSLGGPVLVLLNRRQLLDAANALEILASSGVGKSLSDIAWHAAASGAARNRRRLAPACLSELLSEFMSTIEPARARSVSSYRSVAHRIIKTIPGSTPVAALSEARFAKMLASAHNPTTFNTILSRTKTIFRWAVAQKIMTLSPVENIKPRREPYREPCFFPPQRVFNIVSMACSDKTAAADGIPMFFILGFFAGLRSSEIFRANWEDIELDQATLRVPFPKGITNGGRPRLVELEPAAVALINRFRHTASGTPRHGRIVPSQWKITAWKRRNLLPAGLSWGNDENHNVMRHTYATMHVSAFRNAAATALNLGHGRSSRILEEHYMGLAPRNIGVRYWSMFLPPGVRIAAAPWTTHAKNYEYAKQPPPEVNPKRTPDPAPQTHKL